MISLDEELLKNEDYLKASSETFQRIKNLLDSNNVEYKVIHHRAAGASEDVAAVRNEDVKNGGKAIILKIKDEFKLFVMSAVQKIDTKKIQSKFNTKKIRFATSEELKALTGLIPGCIPPFGEPILPLELFLDDSIIENTRICFNAGTLTDSISMEVKDYLRIAKYEPFSFS